jgi:hypothetical protein
MLENGQIKACVPLSHARPAAAEELGLLASGARDLIDQFVPR